MANKESSKFLGIIEKESIKKVAKYGLIAIGLLGIISLL